MTALLLLLCSVIFAYSHLTDAMRVRQMAESYLSDLLGGRVVVGRATLSVFEGLRLDDVEVHAEPPPAENEPPVLGPDAPDSLLFSAKTFIIRYDPKVMLGGRLEATQIIVQKPHVHLTENVDTGIWNWHRIARRRRGRSRPTISPSARPKLPEILLRNARVDFSEIRTGRFRPLAFMAVDGQLAPSVNGERYNFELQSRGLSEMGPSVSGWVSLGRGQVSAKLLNFSFGHDVRSMLPDEVRRWWERHDLSGRIDIPVLSYTPARETEPASFRVETVIVDGVALSVHGQEWMAASEVRRLERTREAIGMMRGLYRLGGARVKSAAVGAARAGESEAEKKRQAVRPEHVPSAIERVAAFFEPEPLKLENVAGKFVFTQDGISVENVSGRVDNNGLRISGRIEGYTEHAPVALKVTSFATENITIPASPRYIGSLPRQVREFYEQLRPEGTCRLTVEVNRRTRDERPEVSGQLDIVNGKFLYSKFPYPLREVTGRITFGRDPETGSDRVEIRQIRGRGLENGPNRNSFITIDGNIGPLGPHTGVSVKVVATDVSSEETLRQAFPPEVRKALSVFDPTGKGELPRYRGKFACHILRPVGERTPWSFDTDVTLDEASGMLEAFPYPLEHVAGDLKIRTGYVDILGARMNRGDANLVLNGRVSWGREAAAARKAAGMSPKAAASPSGIVTDLAIEARSVPIDAQLLAALPEDRRAWLQKVGISGLLDINGRIFQGIPHPGTPHTDASDGPASRDGVDYDLRLAVRGGTVWPAGGTFAVSDVAGELRLSRNSLEVIELKGKRGAAEVYGSGRTDWKAGRSRVRVAAGAKNLALEPSLYAALPSPARRGWDEVQPQGTVDVEVTYDDAEHPGLAGSAGGGSGSAVEKAMTATADATSMMSPLDVVDLTAPVVAPAARVPRGLKVILRPRDLSVMLKSVPYPLDQLRGTVTVLPDKIVVDDVSGRHGEATVRVAGIGTTGPDGAWDLELAGHNLEVDGAFRRALPPAVVGVVESLKIGGRIGFVFPRFVYRGHSGKGSAPDKSVVAPVTAATARAEKEPTLGADVDLSGSITLSGATLDVGVPLSDVDATITLKDLLVRDGRPAFAEGDIKATSMTMSGRVLRDFRADFLKPAPRDELRLDKMEAKSCGGVIGGNVLLSFPDDAPSRYALNLAVRNADVAQISQENSADVKGTLTASLALEGAWGGLSERRGRGDVVVAGRGMVRVPLVLGLMQITNLAVPLSGPFNEATARYSVEGQKIVFENMELRSDNMVMSGDGSLDFATRQVRLSFITDNPRGLKVPFLNDLLQGARQELMKIHVRGTIHEPRVLAGMMGTFTTTVEEVTRGDPPARAKKR